MPLTEEERRAFAWRVLAAGLESPHSHVLCVSITPKISLLEDIGATISVILSELGLEKSLTHLFPRHGHRAFHFVFAGGTEIRGHACDPECNTLRGLSAKEVIILDKKDFTEDMLLILNTCLSDVPPVAAKDIGCNRMLG